MPLYQKKPPFSPTHTQAHVDGHIIGALTCAMPQQFGAPRRIEKPAVSSLMSPSVGSALKRIRTPKQWNHGAQWPLVGRALERIRISTPYPRHGVY